MKTMATLGNNVEDNHIKACSCHIPPDERLYHVIYAHQAPADLSMLEKS